MNITNTYLNFKMNFYEIHMRLMDIGASKELSKKYDVFLTIHERCIALIHNELRDQ